MLTLQERAANEIVARKRIPRCAGFASSLGLMVCTLRPLGLWLKSRNFGGSHRAGSERITNHLSVREKDFNSVLVSFIFF